MVFCPSGCENRMCPMLNGSSGAITRGGRYNIRSDADPGPTSRFFGERIKKYVPKVDRFTESTHEWCSNKWNNDSL